MASKNTSRGGKVTVRGARPGWRALRIELGGVKYDVQRESGKRVRVYRRHPKTNSLLRVKDPREIGRVVQAVQLHVDEQNAKDAERERRVRRMLELTEEEKAERAAAEGEEPAP